MHGGRATGPLPCPKRSSTTAASRSSPPQGSRVAVHQYEGAALPESCVRHEGYGRSEHASLLPRPRHFTRTFPSDLRRKQSLTVPSNFIPGRSFSRLVELFYAAFSSLLFPVLKLFIGPHCSLVGLCFLCVYLFEFRVLHKLVSSKEFLHQFITVFEPDTLQSIIKESKTS